MKVVKIYEPNAREQHMQRRYYGDRMTRWKEEPEPEESLPCLQSKSVCTHIQCLKRKDYMFFLSPDLHHFYECKFEKKSLLWFEYEG